MKHKTCKPRPSCIRNGTYKERLKKSDIKCFFFKIQATHQCPMKRVINGVTRLYTHGCQPVRTIDNDDEDDEVEVEDDDHVLPGVCQLVYQVVYQHIWPTGGDNLRQGMVFTSKLLLRLNRIKVCPCLNTFCVSFLQSMVPATSGLKSVFKQMKA